LLHLARDEQPTLLVPLIQWPEKLMLNKPCELQLASR